MNSVRGAGGRAVAFPFSTQIRERWDRAKGRLYPYRPRFGDWRFWVVQGLIAAIGGIHSFAEVMELHGYTTYLGTGPRVDLASFVTMTLLFVPVVYAALNFGKAGSVATALWCTVLTLPNIIWFHQGMERWREILQIIAVDAIGLFVGQRVDREMTARQHAESAGAALRVSEAKYRSLFESSPIAVLLLEPGGTVAEANPAAGVLLGRPPAAMRGLPLVALVGATEAAQMLGFNGSSEELDGHLIVMAGKGSDVYLERTLTTIGDDPESPIIQVLLRDVTQERQRREGLRAYAAHVLRAQEEERKRIAQELHDEAVQRVVLLVRRLDVVGIDESLPSQATQGIQEARKSAEEVVQILRDFARALRPSTLEDLGLVTSIRRALLDMTQRSGLKGQMKVVGKERRLHSDVELGLFRIAQEALRNVERHSRASLVTVTITFGSHDATLQVRDDGMGFAVPQSTEDFVAKGHLGLLGMQERAELLGGTLEIQSARGKGAQLHVSIPVDGVATVAGIPGP